MCISHTTTYWAFSGQSSMLAKNVIGAGCKDICEESGGHLAPHLKYSAAKIWCQHLMISSAPALLATMCCLACCLHAMIFLVPLHDRIFLNEPWSSLDKKPLAVDCLSISSRKGTKTRRWKIASTNLACCKVNSHALSCFWSKVYFWRESLLHFW